MQHCDCDNRFHECLMNANTWLSNKIGDFYFNILEKKCYDYKGQPIGCSRITSSGGEQLCTEPIFDLNLAWREFDVPFYLTKVPPLYVIT